MRALTCAGVPSLAQALRRTGLERGGLGGSSGVAGAVAPSAGVPSGQGAESGFADMAGGGNPWRAPRRRSPKQRPPEGGPWRLGYVRVGSNVWLVLPSATPVSHAISLRSSVPPCHSRGIT